MLVANDIRLDTREVADALRRLARDGTPRIIATALQKTAFEIKEAERVAIASPFRFASPNTERFLSTSVRFTAVKPGDTSTTIYPLPKSSAILIEHNQATTIRADKRRLDLRSSLAAPVQGQRGPSGKVRAAESPGRLLERFGERRARTKRQRKPGRYVFVSRSGRAVVEAVSGVLRVLYALTPSARLEQRIDFVAVAEREAKRSLPRKVQEAFDKEARRHTAARRR